MRWGNGFFYDSANKDVLTFTGTVGGHAGTAITVDTVGNIDSGAGLSTIKPIKGGTLTDLLFTPADEHSLPTFRFEVSLTQLGTPA